MQAQPEEPAKAAPTMTGNDNVLDWALQNYLAAKIQRQHILNQGGANFVYNAGRNDEKQLGLPPAITPFPAPTTVQVTQPPPEPRKMATWQQLALGGAMLGAGAALGPLGSMAMGALGNWLGANQKPADSIILPGQGDVGIRIE